MKRYIVCIMLLTLALYIHPIMAMKALRKKQQAIAQEQKMLATPLPCTLTQIFLLNEDIQKGGSTCGPRSIYLAAALERVVLQKKEVNPANLHNALDALNFEAKMKECLPLGEHESDQFQAYIEFIRKNNAMTLKYFFSLNDDPSFGLYIGMPSSKNDISDVILAKLKTELAFNTLTSPIHFICNIGGHWVTFSVTRYEGKITLWYIDPSNSGISHAIKNKFGEYICANLGLLLPI